MTEEYNWTIIGTDGISGNNITTQIIWCNTTETTSFSGNASNFTTYGNIFPFDVTTQIAINYDELSNQSVFENNSYISNVTNCASPPTTEKEEDEWCTVLSLYQFVMWVCVMGSMEILGFIFNSLSFIVMWPDRYA